MSHWVSASFHGVGSLMQSIVAGHGSPTKGTPAQASTVGIELLLHKLQDTTVEFFDCAGQVDYAGMHQIFLTRRALYLLVVDINKYLDVDDLDEVGFVCNPWTLSCVLTLFSQAPLHSF